MILSVIVKPTAFSTALLGIFLMGISTWILTLSILDDPKGSTKNGTMSYNVKPNTTDPLESSTQVYSSTQKDNLLIWEKIEVYLKSNSEKFRVLIQVSTGIAIFTGFLQLTFSWIVLCGAKKDIRFKVKLWQLSNFIEILLLTVSILVPWSYSAKKDNFLGIRSFGKLMKERILFITSGKFASNFKFKSFVEEELNAYYSILILNTVILFVILLCSLCCIKLSK